jgi:hypothetical protein
MAEGPARRGVGARPDREHTAALNRLLRKLGATAWHCGFAARQDHADMAFNSTSIVGPGPRVRRGRPIVDPEAGGRPGQDGSSRCREPGQATPGRRTNRGMGSGLPTRGDARSGASKARPRCTACAGHASTITSRRSRARRDRLTALQTMRGMALVNAEALIANRRTGQSLALCQSAPAYDCLGLVPSEYSSGASVRGGGIAKPGNRAPPFGY